MTITAAAVAVGAVAGMLGLYRVAFVIGLAPFAVVAYRSLAAGSVLIALTSPVVALGSISAGFHVLPCYVFAAAALLGLLRRGELRSFEPRVWDWLLLAFLLVAATVSIANLGAVPHTTVIDAGGVNAPGVRSLAQLAAIAFMGGLYLVVRTALRTPEQLGALSRALVVASGFVVAYAIYQLVGDQLGLPYTYLNSRRPPGALLARDDFHRVNSTLTESSPLAQFMLIGLLLGLAWVRAGAARPSWLPFRIAAAIAAGTAAVIVATLSISAAVACALFAPLVLAFAARRGRVRIGLAAAALILVAALAVLPAVRSQTGSAKAQDGDVVGAQRYVRAGYWIAGVDSVRAHPLGVGVGNFPFYYPLYAPLDPSYEYHVGLSDSHNLFLDVAAETGVVGALLFASFFLSLLWGASRSVLSGVRARAPDGGVPAIIGLALTAALAGGLVMQLTYSYAYYPFVWVLAGIAGSLPLVLREVRR